MKVITRYLTKNPCYRNNVVQADSRYTNFQVNGPSYLMLHSVGCAQPSAEVFIGIWNNENFSDSCVHGVIDGNNYDLYNTLPWNYRGWHCGGTGNDFSIGVEMCESDAIKYEGNKIVIIDRARAIESCVNVYRSAVLTFAMLAEMFNIPVERIISHKEGHSMGIASNHGDPEYYWDSLGVGYTMDGFRKDVKKVLGGESMNVDAIGDELLGKYIKELDDAPTWMQKELEVLLDSECVNGGTDKDDNDKDVNMRYELLRVVIMSKRYSEYLADKVVKKVLKELLEGLGKFEDMGV